MACLFFVLFIKVFYVCFPPTLPDYGELAGREVYIRGRVVSVKQQEKDGSTTVIYTLEEVSCQKDSSGKQFYISDKILYYNSQNQSSHRDSDIHIGSQVWVKGRLEVFDEALNPGQFDSRFYYYIQGIGACMYDGELVWSDGDKNLLQSALQHFKQNFSRKLETYFTPKYAGVMKAILIGDKASLDKGLKELFKEGGILHILTISGLHISMLGMGCFRILRKVGVPMKGAAVLGFLLVLFYGMMIGSQASAVRAICMFAMQMAAVLAGRTYDRLTGLSVAAVLLLLEQPMYIFYSGFLLSFGAVLGITVISPVIEKWCKERGVFWERVGKTFAGGIGILAATLPIQLGSYYEYSLYSMLVNVIVLPFVPVIVGIGAVVLAVPEGLSIVAQPIVYGCQCLLEAYEWICEWTRSFPGHCLVLGAPAWWQTALYYGSLLLCMVKLCMEKGKKYFNLVQGLILALSVVILLWRPAAGLHVCFLSVGQGDSCVIRFAGETYVVDCGSSSNKNVSTQILLPCLKYYGVSEVSGVFLSHGDEDHINGIIQWLEEYEHSHVKIGRILLPDLEKAALQEEFGEVMELAGKWGIPVSLLAQGQVLSLGGLQMEVLHPEAGYSRTEDSNAYSQVLLLTYEEYKILLTGDIGEEQEKDLSCDDVTVLKAAHHGSKYSSSEAFLGRIQPEHAVLSYGVGNSYGHPHTVTLERLQAVGAELWYTGRQGAIQCCIKDGILIMESYPFD